MDTLHFYLQCRANFNKVIKECGLPSIIPNIKLRSCLRCDKHFKSFSKNHRICVNCEVKGESL
jgi:hypothetical protein